MCEADHLRVATRMYARSAEPGPSLVPKNQDVNASGLESIVILSSNFRRRGEAVKCLTGMAMR